MTDEEVFGNSPRLLSDDEVFGSAAPKLLSDEEVFAPQGDSSPSSSFLPIPSVPEAIAQADVEIGKRLVSGVKGIAETALRGTGTQLTGFQQWTLQRALDEANTIDADPKQFPFSGYQQLPPEGREAEKNRLRGLLAGATLANSSLIQAGKAVEEFDKERLTPAAGTTKGPSGVIGDIAEGAGSLIGNMAAGLALGPASIPLFVAGGAGEAQKRAEQKGATEGQQISASVFGNFAGATEFADNLLMTMGGTGKALGLISKVGLAAVTEGAQEGFQQFIQNLIAKGIYDPAQDIMEDVPYNAFLGAVLGGGVRAATHRLNNEGAIPDAGAAPADRNIVNSTVQQVAEQTVEQQQTGMPKPFDIAAARQFTEGPIWVSKLRDAAEQKLPQSASPDQILATLTNSPGIKQEEIEATGLRDFLAKSGNRVAKEDVIAHLEENQVKVEERATTPPNLLNQDDTDRLPQYEKQTLPGAKEGYRELVLKLPASRKWGEQNQDFRGSHFENDVNVLAWVRSTDRIDHTGANILMIEEVQSDWHQQGRRFGYRSSTQPETMSFAPANRVAVPDAPFKTSWPELAFKRMLRWAADNGHDRIAWTTGQQQIDRYPGLSAERQSGMEEFYDRILPSIAKKYAKRYGAQVGNTQLGGITSAPMRVPYIEVTPKMRSDVREGLPLFAKTFGPASVNFTDDVAQPGRKISQPIGQILSELKTKFKIDRPLRIVFTSDVVWGGAKQRGLAARMADGSYLIRLSLNLHHNIEGLWATAAHEFGHILVYDKFEHLSDNHKQAILAAYDRWRDTNATNTSTLGQMIESRDNAIAIHYDQSGIRKAQQDGQPAYGRPLTVLRPEDLKYWAGFDEWMAEQVAKYMTTRAAPVTLIDRIFNQLGTALREVYATVRDTMVKKGIDPSVLLPNVAVAEWLESFVTDAPPIGAEFYAALNAKTMTENQSAFDSVSEGIEASPQTPETSGIGNIVDHSTGDTRQELKRQRAYADKINWFYRTFLHVFQMGELNRHVEPLQRFIEFRRSADVDEAKINDAAMRIMKEWRRLSRAQNEATVALINDVTNMTYRTDDEVKRQIARHPTSEEFQALVRKHRVNEQGVEVFRQVKRFFDTFLELNRQNAVKDATRNISDPKLRATKIDEINTSIVSLQSRPYFPFMRFGEHVVVVKDSAGHIVYREHLERSGLMSAEARQKLLGQELRKRFPARDGYEVNDTIVLDEQAAPLIGMPRILLDQIADKMDMSKSQRDAMEQLRFELSPAQSFKHRFQHKNYVPGYSQDFQRAFAKYAFHGAKHYVRVKYADDMRQSVSDTRAGQETSLNPTKRRDIARYMHDALEKGFLNPKADFIYFKAGVVMWTLAFVPASALLNLTQTATMTAPFLGAKFGDLRAGRAMLKSITHWSNFYKKGAYDKQTGFEMRAMDYAIKTGRLDQTLAAELAGFSESSNLGNQAGNFMRRGLHKTMEVGMKLFELAEKMNRRIAFSAALDLALNNPNAKYIKEIVPSYSQELQVLQAQFSETEAQAIVVANHIVEQTQFLQGEAARPRIMRGRLGTLFLYKRFIQGVLFTVSNNKRDVLPRFLVMSMLLGGLGGVPGFEDLKELWKMIGWMWGKEVSLDKVIREWLRQYTQDGRAAEMLLHGLSRDSFGIPALLALMGSTYGMPHVDMSAAMSPGTITPLELGKLFGPPTKSPQETAGAQAIKAGGAPGSVAFGFYKALTSKDDLGEFKRWEAAMPRALRGVSKAYRTYQEGAEKNSKGATVVKYDARDPGQLAEVIGMSLGFQPTRSRLQWDQITAAQETIKVIDLQRGMLLKQYDEARRSSDPKEFDRVKDRIREFNTELPQEQRGKAISSDTIQRSMRVRDQDRAANEQGISRRKADIPIYRKVQELYPGAELIDARRVR